jgi:hypothetical protein
MASNFSLIKCEECPYVFKTEEGLKIHIVCTLKCCYQEKVFGNLGFLLHVLIIGASLAFRGLHICFYIYHIDSTQRRDTFEKEVGKDTHG